MSFQSSLIKLLLGYIFALPKRFPDFEYLQSGYHQLQFSEEHFETAYTL